MKIRRLGAKTADPQPIRFGVSYAFRNLNPLQENHHEYLQRKLDEIEAVEAMGFDELRVAEHHQVDDGYVPCPLVATAAIAARTTKIRLGPGILLAPFYHPVRLAEEASYVDNLSGGRFSLTLGLGYRSEEFAAYGMKRSERATRAAEVMEVLLKCLEGEPFSHRGRYFELENVDIRPRPFQEPRFPVWVGAHSRGAMERAVRLGIDGLLGAEADLELWRDVNEELRPGSDAKFAAPLPVNFIPSEDPERDWALYRDRLAVPVRQYADWAAGSGDNKRVNAPRFGMQRTDEDLARVTRFASTDEILKSYLSRIELLVQYETVFVLSGGITELPGDVNTRALELFATKVMPVVKEHVAIARRQRMAEAIPDMRNGY